MIYKVSERPGQGRYVFLNCGESVLIYDDDTLPPCVICEEGEFRKG